VRWGLALGGAALAIGIGVAGASGGVAGPPGQWTRVSETNGVNTDDIGLARTGDGVLHVAWHRDEAGSKEGLWHTPIAANGSVGSATAIATNWASANFPDLIRTADGGLRIFFGGIRSTNAGETNNALNTATAPAAGTSWTLKPGRASRTTVTYATSVGAGLATDGTPVSVWEDASPNANGWHWGVDQNGPEFGYERSGCCVYKPDVGVDSASGAVAIVWYSNVTGKAGLYALGVGSGGATGSVQYVPGSANANRTNAVSFSQRTGITGRIGGPGIYVGYGSGYPTLESVRIWRFGDAGPLISIAARGARYVDIATAPEGRLWLIWERSGRLWFTRTNRAATKAGTVFSIRPPAGTRSIWRLHGEGSLGPLDVLAHVSTSGSLATWHTQVLPALQLKVKSRKAVRKKGKLRYVLARFSVTDAGDAVQGAQVRAGGKTVVTNAAGTSAAVKLTKGRNTVTASKSGYRPARASIRVR
jgi:hypothetical protein